MSPDWRITTAVALTGLGVDGAVGWNGRLMVSYLIIRWFDVRFPRDCPLTKNGQIPFGGELVPGLHSALGVRCDHWSLDREVSA
jgi:hypothetical protein